MLANANSPATKPAQIHQIPDSQILGCLHVDVHGPEVYGAAYLARIIKFLPRMDKMVTFEPSWNGTVGKKDMSVEGELNWLVGG